MKTLLFYFLFILIPILGFAQEYTGPTTARSGAQVQDSEMKVNKILDDAKTGAHPLNVAGSFTTTGTGANTLSVSGTASDTSGTLTSGTLTIAAGARFIEVFPVGATPAAASMNVVTTGTITVSGSNYGAFIRTAPTGMVLPAYSLIWNSGVFNYGVLR